MHPLFSISSRCSAMAWPPFDELAESSLRSSRSRHPVADSIPKHKENKHRPGSKYCRWLCCRRIRVALSIGKGSSGFALGRHRSTACPWSKIFYIALQTHFEFSCGVRRHRAWDKRDLSTWAQDRLTSISVVARSPEVISDVFRGSSVPSCVLCKDSPSAK